MRSYDPKAHDGEAPESEIIILRRCEEGSTISLENCEGYGSFQRQKLPLGKQNEYN